MRRLADGFDVRDLVTEYFLLRQVLLGLVLGRSASLDPVSDAQLVCWAVDASVRESVAAFTRAMQEELEALDRSTEALATRTLQVTERRQLEEALRESETKFRDLADNIAQLAWMADEAGWIFWYNRRWFDYTGTTLEQMQGWGWQKVHHPDHVDRVVDRIRHCFETGETWEDTFPLRSKDGSYRWFLSRAIPIRDGAGKVVRWFGTNTDVTELRDAHDATLRRTNEQLLEYDRRKNEFLGMLSHELRNPLAPIRNSIYLLERSAPGSQQETHAKDVIRRQTEHLTRLVDDLLEVTRISRGKIALKRSRIDLRDIVLRTTDDLRSLFEEAGVELRVDDTSGPAWIIADPTRITQVLGNLLQNAVKFTTAGGSATVTLAAKADHAELRVRDTGVGMEPEKIELMFAPFVQGEMTLARTKGGLGVGLPLVKGLVELHGGTVEAHSDGLGRGAEFIVRVPLAGADREPPGAA